MGQKLGFITPENGPESPVYVEGMGSRFITVEGDPILPSDVEPELRQIDPFLKIEFVRGFGGMNAWVLKREWKQSDKRWARVQSGELPRHLAFDEEHRFPRDCPTGQMVAYVRARWGDRANGSTPEEKKKLAEKMIEDAMKLQREAAVQAEDELVQKGTQRVLDESDHLRQLRSGLTGERVHPMVSGMDFDGPKRLI